MGLMSGMLPVCLYGLDPEYRVVRYWNIKDKYPSMGALEVIAEAMQKSRLNILSVFAVDVSKDVYEAARDSMRTNTVEDRVVFKILLEETGIQLI